MASPRRKKTDVEPETGTATADPGLTTSPGDAQAAEPASDTNGTAEPPTPSNGNGNSDRKALHVFSYLVGPDTYVQCSVWQREVQRRDGTSFTAYDCSVRKRYKDQRDGEWKTLYSFHASELYAVQHAFQQAASYIVDLRAADVPF